MNDPTVLHLGVRHNTEAGFQGGARRGLWREEYLKRRYLEHATHKELAQRLDDIFVNLIRFTDDGQAIVRMPIEENPFAALVGHVLHELGLRGTKDNAFPVRNLHFDNAAYPNVGRAAALWRGRGLKPGSCMLKFGKIEFLEPLRDCGAIRIFPASFYREPSLAAAVQDNELEFSQQVCGAQVRCQDSAGEWHDITTARPVRLTRTAATNYYLSSYAILFENRLFDDFKADGCLIIKDVDGYCNRICQAFNTVLPRWTRLIGGIQYLDPYRPTKEFDICFAKHMRYSYQREFRIVWGPPKPQQDLQPIDLLMGDLSSFCELIRL